MMFGLSGEDLILIKKILSCYPEVEKAVIFGSRAKGNFKKGSDVDIALIGNNLDNVIWQIHFQLEEETLMPYYFDLINYNKIVNAELKEHIDRVGKMIYEK